MSQPIERARVVVTGTGAISPLGNNVKETWQGLIEGKSGIKRINDIREAVNSEVDIAGLIEGFDPTQYLTAKDLLKIHRSAAFSTIASIEALQQADLLTQDRGSIHLINIQPERIGARIGSGVGGGVEIAEVEDVIRDKGDQRISARALLIILQERVVTVPSIKLGFQGPISSIVAACATGSIAIGDAVDKIRLGKADAMLGGGVEAAIHRVSVGGFNVMHALSKENDPEGASRPFDQGASGFVMGEGAGILVLESLEHVRKRGAENLILAEVAGYADTADAYHDTAPSGEGAQRAMILALQDAGLDYSSVDYINAHGTSTPTGDSKELDALIDVFGDHLKNIPISSTKSSLGHLLGAAGGIEAVICIQAIQDGIVPPTLNLQTPIREGLDLVPLQARKRKVDVAMSNSFGFGGINSVLIFKRFINE